MTANDLTTMLFVPATKPERIPKAVASGDAAVIVDLEDAVPAGAKEEARAALDLFLATNPESAVFVRVNARGTAEYSADIDLCRRHTNVAGIVLPKAESAADIVSAAEVGKPVIPLIETALGIRSVNEIAAARGVERLSYGGLDLSDDLGIEGGTEGAQVILDHCRYQLLIASRVAGLPAPIETVFPVFDDPDAVTQRARRVRNMGFGGMLCIHPKQVGPVQSGFAPTQEQVAWAERVITAAESAEGAFKVDGQMVDAPVIAMARSILARVA